MQTNGQQTSQQDAFKNALLNTLNLINDSATACTYQTLGQYRSMLSEHISQAISKIEEAASGGHEIAELSLLCKAKDEAGKASFLPSGESYRPPYPTTLNERLARWPSGIADRIDSAIQRIADGHAIRRVPADPTDPDLVLAELRALISGAPTPFWLDTTSKGGVA